MPLPCIGLTSSSERPPGPHRSHARASEDAGQSHLTPTRLFPKNVFGQGKEVEIESFLEHAPVLG